MRAETRVQTGWDRDKAKLLYDQGLSYAAIGREVGCTACAVSGHANRAGWSRVLSPQDAALASNFRYGQPPKLYGPPPPPSPPPARLLHPGEPTLPPLMSLTYGD